LGGLAASLVARPVMANDLFGDLVDIFTSKKTSSPSLGALTSQDVTAGLRQALTFASGRTIDRVGQEDGYLLDAAIHIPLPGQLQSAQKTLASIGLYSLFDDLEERLNRAAEFAAPRARDIFVVAIGAMTIEDAMGILQGPDDSATRYFEGAMTPDLKTSFHPVFEEELNQSGALTTLGRITNHYNSIPFMGNLDRSVRSNLIDHGLTYALSGMFHYLAKEEAAIRNDPAKRTTQLLQRVFG